MTDAITLDEIGRLPVVLTSAELAARILRCDPDTLYDLNRRGELPFKPLSLGRKLVWPTAEVLSSLGLDLAALLAQPDDDSEEPPELPSPLQVVRAAGAQSS